jgi:hypothetical protein
MVVTAASRESQKAPCRASRSPSRPDSPSQRDEHNTRERVSKRRPTTQAACPVARDLGVACLRGALGVVVAGQGCLVGLESNPGFRCPLGSLQRAVAAALVRVVDTNEVGPLTISALKPAGNSAACASLVRTSVQSAGSSTSWRASATGSRNRARGCDPNVSAARGSCWLTATRFLPLSSMSLRRARA